MTWDVSHYRALIEEALALSGGTHSFEDVAAGIADHRYQFWPALRSVVVTEIIDFPRARVAHCFLAAGDLSEIQRQRVWLETWAKGLGCTRVTLAGRPGWERALAPAGYERSAVMLEKKLEVPS